MKTWMFPQRIVCGVLDDLNACAEMYGRRRQGLIKVVAETNMIGRSLTVTVPLSTSRS